MSDLLRRFSFFVLIGLLLPLSLQAQSSTPGPQSGETIRILWGNDGGEDIVLRELLREFERRTGIQVEIQLTSHEDRPAEFIQALEGDTPPDLIRHIYYNGMSDYWRSCETRSKRRNGSA